MSPAGFTVRSSLVSKVIRPGRWMNEIATRVSRLATVSGCRRTASTAPRSRAVGRFVTCARRSSLGPWRSDRHLVGTRRHVRVEDCQVDVVSAAADDHQYLVHPVPDLEP